MIKPSGLGIWCSTNVLKADELATLAASVEAAGFETLWYPESLSYEAVAMGGFLLDRTSKLKIASGIANIYARDPVTSAQAHDALNTLYDGRFILGLGVSHVPLVEKARGHSYGKPVSTMRDYLSAMQAAPIDPTIKQSDRNIVLAALGPNMLALSRDQAKGALPYCVTPEHTAQAREILGPDAWLCVEQKICLVQDATTARAVGRQQMTRYMALPNYRNNWLRLGFTEEEVTGAGADRFIDAMVVWGSETQIGDVINAHRKAGADQVVLQAFPAEGGAGTDPKAIQAFSGF